MCVGGAAVKFLDGLFGFFTIFDWVTPLIQFGKSIIEDAPKMVRLQSIDPFVEIYGADFPKALGILGNFGIHPGWMDVSIPPLYPLIYWKTVRIPQEQEDEIFTTFDLAGIRYKA